MNGGARKDGSSLECRVWFEENTSIDVLVQTYMLHNLPEAVLLQVRPAWRFLLSMHPPLFVAVFRPI